ncbi:hypothetical protein JHK82_052509 [Glycine max]|nr:hypothetical protein JHK82_052509 [Glycine max]
MELIGKKVKGVYFRTSGDHCRYPVVLIGMYSGFHSKMYSPCAMAKVSIK